MSLPAQTTAFRLEDEVQPGVTVDRFGPVAILSLYRDAPDEAEIAQRLLGLEGITSVYAKRRPREARKVANASPGLLAPSVPIAGVAVDSLIVTELATKYEIRPGNGLSVGLYLDARDARAWVKAHARDRTVLNTFAYTCGFGLSARLGGATRAVNIDASRKVLDWGEANYALNGISTERYDFISGDTFDWLNRFAKKGETFELVVLDPPGFATTSDSRFSAQRDYHRLVSAAERVTAKGGLLLAMCNIDQSARAFDEQLLRGLGARPQTRVATFGASAVDFRQPSALRCVALCLG